MLRFFALSFTPQCLISLKFAASKKTRHEERERGNGVFLTCTGGCALKVMEWVNPEVDCMHRLTELSSALYAASMAALQATV